MQHWMQISGILASASASAEAGGYFSLARIIIMLVFVAPWLYIAPLVYKDAVYVRARHYMWGGLVIGAGVIGLVIWLLVPIFLVGMAIFLVACGSAIGAYVVYRNSRVPEERRILTAEHISGLLNRRHKNDVQPVSRIKAYDHLGKSVPAPTTQQDDPAEIEAYNIAQDFLYELIWQRASEADVSPGGGQCQVRFVTDGVVNNQPPLDPAAGEMLMQYLKRIGGMNVEDRRRPQTGRMSVDLAGKQIDLQLTSAGTTGGQRMQFRVVQESVQTVIQELGMSKEVLDRLTALNHMPNGLIVVSGSGRSGVTSTLYSLLREHDAFTKHLVSLETKPSVDMENITQTAYGEPAKLPEVLAAALRREPDVLMVDHCEDAAAAGLILSAAEKHMVLLGMRAPDSFSALARWVKLCGPAGPAVKNLLAITCQTLLRKLCQSCREAYRPDPAMLAKINIPSRQVEQFYRPPSGPVLDEKGQPVICSVCHGTGYFGRVGAFELLEVSDELRGLVAAGASLTEIKSACRKNKMLYLQEQALIKVISGVTSVQEVIRVSQQGKKPQGT